METSERHRTGELHPKAANLPGRNLYEPVWGDVILFQTVIVISYPVPSAGVSNSLVIKPSVLTYFELLLIQSCFCISPILCYM